MSKSSHTTKYTCILTLLFTGDQAIKGQRAFTKGKVYEGEADPYGVAGDIELTDDTGGLHTITANLFLTLFTEHK